MIIKVLKCVQLQYYMMLSYIYTKYYDLCVHDKVANCL